MTDSKELYQLSHPETWPHGGQLPVILREGSPIVNRKHCGIILKDDLLRVWADVHLGEDNSKGGIPMVYSSPEHLLSEWEID